MSKNAALRLLAVGLLLGWCGLFLRTETTEKSMVRLIFADLTETGWTVGLLYQFPEAAADSADAAASVRLELGEGETPEKALLAAEKALHQRANYRLCEYLLLGPDWRGSTLQTWEPLVQQHSSAFRSSCWRQSFRGQPSPPRRRKPSSCPSSCFKP